MEGRITLPPCFVFPWRVSLTGRDFGFLRYHKVTSSTASNVMCDYIFLPGYNRFYL